MPVTYCSSCGHKTSYTLDKPKFCSECGQSFGTLTRTVAQPKKDRESRDDIDEEGTDIYTVPKIKGGLQYDVEFNADTSFTLGSLLPPPPEPSRPKKKRGRPRKKK